MIKEKLNPEEKLEEIRKFIIKELDDKGIPYNHSREPIVEKGLYTRPFLPGSLDVFLDKVKITKEVFVNTYRELSKGVNEIINDTVTGYILGHGLVTSILDYEDNFPESKHLLEIIYKMLFEEGITKNEVIESLMMEHMRPIGDSSFVGKLDEYLEMLGLEEYDWIKEFLNEDVTLLEVIFVIYSMENPIEKKSLKKKALNLFKKHFSGVTTGYDKPWGFYSPYTGSVKTNLSTDITKKRNRNFRIRAATKGLFIGIMASSGLGLVPFLVSASMVIVASDLDVKKHKFTLEYAKENNFKFSAHELIHQLSASKDDSNSKSGSLWIR